MINKYNILAGNLKGDDNLEHVGVDVRTVAIVIYKVKLSRYHHVGDKAR
jgi:hypothetical protein